MTEAERAQGRVLLAPLPFLLQASLARGEGIHLPSEVGVPGQGRMALGGQRRGLAPVSSLETPSQ